MVTKLVLDQNMKQKLHTNTLPSLAPFATVYYKYIVHITTITPNTVLKPICSMVSRAKDYLIPCVICSFLLSFYVCSQLYYYYDVLRIVWCCKTNFNYATLTHTQNCSQHSKQIFNCILPSFIAFFLS